MTLRDEARDGGADGGALGEGFPAIDDQRWRTRVGEELRGAPFESLVSTLPGGIEVQPLYHQRPWGDGEAPQALPGVSPFVRGARPAGESGAWLRCARVAAPDLDAAKVALAADLRGGCDGLWLRLDIPASPPAELPVGAVEHVGGGDEPRSDGIPIGTPEALAALLADVDLERVAIFLDAGAGSLAGAGFALQVLRLRGAESGEARLFLGIDPIGELAAEGALPDTLDRCEAAMAALATHCAAELPRSRAVTVSALPWHDAGATPAQELGWAFAALVRSLRRMEEAGLDVETAAGQIVLRVAVGRDFFLGIAKLRALRRLWAKLLAACGAADPPAPFVHAVSSDFALTRRDPWTNLLRVTTEVFAAVTGGADAITAAPYDRLLRSADDPAGSRLGRRIARNTQHVLSEEAHLGRVADPAGGSYYLETLTDELARAAWDEMRRVEASGGIAEHLRSGRLGEEAEAAWRARRRVLVEGNEAVLGVSVYSPPEGERAEELDADGGRRSPSSRRTRGILAGEVLEPLPRHRLAEPFEDEGVAPPAGAGTAEESA